MTFDDMIGQAINRGCQVKHQWSKRDIPNKPFRNLLKTVWGNLEPLHINLDALRQYVDTHHSAKNMMFYRNFLSHLAEVGVDLISDTPLVVAYRQSYKSAKIGGRSFEIGTSFQSLPSKMKWACLARGYNYDIKRCQLEILRHELQSIDVSDRNLRLLDSKVICKVLGVDEALVKQFRYASVFNSGYVSLSFRSATVRLLRKEFGRSKAKLFSCAGLNTWSHSSTIWLGYWTFMKLLVKLTAMESVLQMRWGRPSNVLTSAWQQVHGGRVM
ncbi:hypothetical protein [Serratia sp. UGAL515B_01]|uniref:hypothetical protein n=1 Tax=Serratia sp. UGAL515B_01 TaxID=2986763 RepID=UPI002954DF2A|nr:hypothetical protein [Serratia sp. UGAL515B_01]WON76265.1 hypothetical protein OK023_13625 [Serratia sp. UGAL515B_01]